MDFKRIKLDEISLSTCCICKEKGISHSFTNIFNISLREQNLVHNFVDVIYFVLDIHISHDTPDICNTCKMKIIEYFHYKKRSQAYQKNFSGLILELKKIVHNFIQKNFIKAITIEESSEKLLIMRKTPQLDNLPAKQCYEEPPPPDIEIKREKESEQSIQNEPENTFHNTEIKSEPEESEDRNEEEEMQIGEISIKEELIDNEPISNNFPYNTEPTEPPDPDEPNRLDLLLRVNREIFNEINLVNKKLDHQMNLLLQNLYK